jgi:DNA-binding Xre family transcriptional regulator
MMVLPCEIMVMERSFPIDAVRASIKRMMDESGDKPKPLAAKLKLSETGIRDIFLPKTKSISAPKLDAIARHYGVTVDDILAGRASMKTDRVSYPRDVGSTEKIRSLGNVASGVWLEQSMTMELPEDEWDYVEYDRSAGDPGIENLFSVRPIGDSMDIRFPGEPDLICRWVKFGFADVEVGKYYIIEREAHDLREMTCKRLEISMDGSEWLLCSESSNPKWAEPIRIKRSLSDEHVDNGVSIIGRVIRSVTRFD